MPEVKTINLPDFGDFDEVEVIEICVKTGQKVNSEEPILVLETDKAAMEIPSSVDGTVKEVLLNTGDKVAIGMPFLDIELADEIDEPVTTKQPIEENDNKETKIDEVKAVDENATKINSSNVTQTNTQLNNHRSSKVHSGPATRKLAREFGIDLSKVKGSGPKNRILKEDLHEYVKNILSFSDHSGFKNTQPAIDFAKWGDITKEELTKFQKTSVSNLHSSWINIPHVTQHDDANITNLLKLRNKLNKKNKCKISPLAYVIKSTAEVLIDYRDMNSSLSSDLNSIIYKDYINIGIAIDTSYGLIVPNIKNANKKSIFEISEEVKELASLANKRRLKNDQLVGATFTISSLSGIGGKYFTPIINPPEVGILGLSKTYDSLQLDNLKLQTTNQLPLSLSYDHRVINGVYAIKFLNELNKQLNDINFLESSFK
ncbi:MAG: dihydrolipoyllysine acetyltransferase [Gammaproteobacteria bacterium]|nr:dihydrolipoyllysine acetyltransferase [Gammaproteobacteria bacterium]